MEFSRLCVKNIPSYMTVDKLRSHFQKKGEVSDVKIMKTKDGASRRLAYVGYLHPQDAAAAQKFFSKTFIDTARIIVEPAKTFGDPSIPRPWSKYSKGSSRHRRMNPGEYEKMTAGVVSKDKRNELQEKMEKKFTSVLSKKEKDKKLSEFLNVMKSKQQRNIWANDGDDNFDVPVKKKRRKVVESRKRGGDGVFMERIHIKFGEDGVEEEKKEEKEKEEEESSDDELYEDAEFRHPKEEVDSKVEKEETEDVEKDTEKEEDGVVDEFRVFVRNLAYGISEEEMQKFFEQFGEVSSVHIPVDSSTHKQKGFAYVSFISPESSVKAVSKGDMGILNGRMIHVIPAKKQKKRIFEQQNVGGSKRSSYKQKKRAQKRSEAANPKSWNTLYMRTDTVADSMAQTLGVKKSDVVDRDADNVAVRLALGEAELVREGREILEKEGIDVRALEKGNWEKSSRSDIMILAKNLPFSTTEEELYTMFGEYGDVSRVVLLPSKTTALIEFYQKVDATRAFHKLAYKNYHHVPLYLEWAPVSVVKPVEIAAKHVDKEEVDNAAEDSALTPVGSTIFVKNINFSSNYETLREVFARCGAVRACSIAKKKSSATGEARSMGYGFVEFSSRDEATKAMKMLQGVVVDGHALQLKFSNRNENVSSQKDSKRRSRMTDTETKKSKTKIIIRNIAFETTRKDVRELCSAYGHVKSVRLPKKFDGGHRGFCFVEFVSNHEAKSAMEGLGSTHLYGRHLVLEWANAEDSFDSLREKAAVQLDRVRNAEKKRERIETDD